MLLAPEHTIININKTLSQFFYSLYSYKESYHTKCDIANIIPRFCICVSQLHGWLLVAEEYLWCLLVSPPTFFKLLQYNHWYVCIMCATEKHSFQKSFLTHVPKFGSFLGGGYVKLML